MPILSASPPPCLPQLQVRNIHCGDAKKRGEDAEEVGGDAVLTVAVAVGVVIIRGGSVLCWVAAGGGEEVGGLGERGVRGGSMRDYDMKLDR